MVAARRRRIEIVGYGGVSAGFRAVFRASPARFVENLRRFGVVPTKYRARFSAREEI
jgi:hypothetical protein